VKENAALTDVRDVVFALVCEKVTTRGEEVMQPANSKVIDVNTERLWHVARILEDDAASETDERVLAHIHTAIRNIKMILSDPITQYSFNIQDRPKLV
jgi:hypothetical protein